MEPHQAVNGGNVDRVFKRNSDVISRKIADELFLVPVKGKTADMENIYALWIKRLRIRGPASARCCWISTPLRCEGVVLGWMPRSTPTRAWRVSSMTTSSP